MHNRISALLNIVYEIPFFFKIWQNIIKYINLFQI